MRGFSPPRSDQEAPLWVSAVSYTHDTDTDELSRQTRIALLPQSGRLYWYTAMLLYGFITCGCYGCCGDAVEGQDTAEDHVAPTVPKDILCGLSEGQLADLPPAS